MRIFLLFCGLMILGCSAEVIPADDLQNKLSQLVVNKPIDSFYLKEFTDFEWDEVYIVKPYCPTEEYNKLTYKIEDLPDLGIVDFASDQLQYLIFVKRNLAIKYMMPNRVLCCDFTTIRSKESIARISSDAILLIKRSEFGYIRIFDRK